MTFKSAYLKLTLFYVLVVMIISIGFSVAIYNISSNELEQGLGRQTRMLRDIPVSGSPLADTFDELRQQQLDASNSHLQLNLINFNLLILILASIASYFFARFSLRPIEEGVAEQNRFTADASHELRTPLTAIRTEVEVALRDNKMSLAQAKKLLASNLEEIGKLEALSSSLLKLARHDDTQKNFEPVSLEEVVTESFEKVESLADAKKIVFQNHLIPLEIDGDRQSLVELFVIILDNAIKYSQEKSKINIEISKERNHAIVKIKDHGIGIKASEIPYIFNRFYRADSSRSKEKTDGYGLGLSIAKKIVEIHNGVITVESKLGRGSEFVVQF